MLTYKLQLFYHVTFLTCPRVWWVIKGYILGVRDEILHYVSFMQSIYAEKYSDLA